MSFNLLNPILGSLDQKVALHDGYIQLSAAAAVVTHNIKGATVAKTGTGEYTITITKPGYAIKYANCAFVAPAAVDLVAQIKSFTNSVVVIRLNAAATPTDPVAACGLMFFCISTGSKL